MLNNTTVVERKIVAAIAGIAGLLSIIVVPEMGMKVVNLVTKNASMAMDMLNRPNIIAAPKLVSFWYPFWSGLSVVAGIVLLLSVLPLARGEKWGRPMALGALFIPTIFGIYAFWPITFFSRIIFGEISFGQASFFAKELLIFPLAIFLIGIVPFFTILLSGKATLKSKLAQFFVYFTLIFATALSFMNGHTALRALWSSIIDKPQIIDKALAVGTVVNWLAVILIIVGIPYLVSKAYKGWFLCLMGNLAIIMGNAILLASFWDTWDYRISIILALISSVLLIIPGIKMGLVDEANT